MLWHEQPRRALKAAVLGAVHYTGVLPRIRRAYAKDSAVILMYHRVTPPDQGVPDYSPNGMSVTPAEFAMQMQFIRKHYDVVSLTRIVDEVARSGGRPLNLCAVTFDDGWHDIYEHAFPMMRELQIPATVFLTTGYVDGAAWSWTERAPFLLSAIHSRRRRLAARSDYAELRERLRSHDLHETLEVRPARLRSYINLKKKMLDRSAVSERKEAVNCLEEVGFAAGISGASPFLTWCQVKEMAEAGVDFGNHTVTHPVLTRLSDDKIQEEVREADRRLSEQLGPKPRYFAYPYGKFDERVENAVKTLGVQGACTTQFGRVRPGDSALALKRINVASDATCVEPLFAGRLLGL